MQFEESYHVWHPTSLTRFSRLTDWRLAGGRPISERGRDVLHDSFVRCHWRNVLPRSTRVRQLMKQEI